MASAKKRRGRSPPRVRTAHLEDRDDRLGAYARLSTLAADMDPAEVLLAAMESFYRASKSGDEHAKAVAVSLESIWRTCWVCDQSERDAFLGKGGPHAWALARMRTRASDAPGEKWIPPEATTRAIVVRALAAVTKGTASKDAAALSNRAADVLFGRHAVIGVPAWSDEGVLQRSILHRLTQMSVVKWSDEVLVVKQILRAAGLSEKDADNAMRPALLGNP